MEGEDEIPKLVSLYHLKRVGVLNLRGLNVDLLLMFKAHCAARGWSYKEGFERIIAKEMDLTSRRGIIKPPPEDFAPMEDDEGE